MKYEVIEHYPNLTPGMLHFKVYQDFAAMIVVKYTDGDRVWLRYCADGARLERRRSWFKQLIERVKCFVR